MKTLVRCRDKDTGAPEAEVSVTFRRIDGGATVGTDTSDADGIAELVANGNPGPIEWTATHQGQTQIVAGDLSFQTGPYYTGELDKIMLIFGDGVVSGGDNGLAVLEPGGGGRNVDVATGIAFVKGIPYIGHTLETLAVTANASGNPRIDRVVVRVTRTGADIYAADVVVVAGTPAGSPSAPALTQDANTWEISLAQVAVANGAASILTANITDERTYAPGTTLDNSISTAKLQDDAVTVAKLSTGAELSTAEIAKVLKAPTSGNNPTYAVLTLGELSDVLTTVPTTGQVLQWNGSAWVPATSGAGITVKEGGSVVDTDITTLDFDTNAFVLSETPENEVNISPQFGSGASNIAQGNHTHDLSHPASVRNTEYRNYVTDGTPAITSTTGQEAIAFDLSLSSSQVYDCLLTGGIQGIAPAGGSWQAGAKLGDTTQFGAGEGTETGEKFLGVSLVQGITGVSTLRCAVMVKKVGGSGNGSYLSGNLSVMCLPRHVQ